MPYGRPHGPAGALKGLSSTRGHGSVYTSKDFHKACKDLGVTQSMGAVGTSADNALAESFNATFKREVLMDERAWPDGLTCRRQAFRWLTRYNTVRRHSYCDNLPPNTYENHYTPATPATMLEHAA